MKNYNSGPAKYLAIGMFFVCGSFVTVLNSIILKNSYPWRYNTYLQFKKPWFQNWIMFIGMSIFFIPNTIKYLRKRKESEDGVSIFVLFRESSLPSLLYILATVLQNYALIYMPPTVWQVFFGFQILFTTLFAVTYRKQHLYLVDWLGLFISVAGMSFTGVAALLRGTDTSTDSEVTTIFFMFIIAIFSHGVKSFQTILEERLLHDRKITGSELTGLEGIWGFYVSTFISLPICNVLSPGGRLGLYENTLESFEMISMSAVLRNLLIGFFISVTLFSYSGLLITEFSTAIHRNMYEIIRPLPVWLLSLAARYLTGIEGVGETVDRYTILEMAGFAISVIGSIIYNRVWRFGCFLYVETNETDTKLNSTTQYILDESPLLKERTDYVGN